MAGTLQARGGRIATTRGVRVAHHQSPASEDQARAQIADDPSRDAAAGLTRAKARALRRGAPLTPTQFKQLRHLAEHGINPLQRM